MLAISEVLKVADRPIQTLQAADTVMQAIDRFGKTKVRALLVTDGDTLLGLVTVRDVLKYVGLHGAAALETEIAAMMTRDVTTVSPTTRLDDAAALFAETSYNHLPVVKDGQLVGVVTPADVLRHRVQHVEAEAGYLRDYINGVYF